MSDNENVSSDAESRVEHGLDTLLGVCSLLHEPGNGSAGRTCYDEPVLKLTLERLSDCQFLDGLAVICWQDQQAAAELAAADVGASVLPIGPRDFDRVIHDAAVAQRWSDGWRGGLLSTTPFDAGFHPAAAKMLLDATDASGLVLVDPSSALLDEALIDELITHARCVDPHQCRPGLFFSPAAPGLNGMLLRRDLVGELAKGSRLPGKLLSYDPRSPIIDPLGAEYCYHLEPTISRSLGDFRLRSNAQIHWAEEELTEGTIAEALCEQAKRSPRQAPIELNIDATTQRHTQPIWLKKQGGSTLHFEMVERVMRYAATQADDLRLTFGGRGDPLCWPHLWKAIDLAKSLEITAIHVETDLLPAGDDLAKLLTAGVEIVSVHLPAMSAATYEQVMGTNSLAETLAAMSQLMMARDRLGGPTPLIVPTFVKTQTNTGEMETWYDQWLGATGSAVVRGPDAFGNDAPAGVEAVAMQRTERRSPAINLDAIGHVTDQNGQPISIESDLQAAA